MSTTTNVQSESLGHRLAVPEAEFQIKKLITKYSHLFTEHQWPSEHGRWIELLFALVCGFTTRPEQEIRRLIEDLDEMNLLEVDDLAHTPSGSDQASQSGTYSARLLTILREAAFSHSEANDIFLSMHSAARAVKDQYDGKIQHFLRKHGELMVQELLSAISPPAPVTEKTRWAITYWLQNVLDMPIVLSQSNLHGFCRKYGITEAELTAAADKLHLNVALMDDMIDQCVIDEGKGARDV